MEQDDIIYKLPENTLELYRQDTWKENEKFADCRTGRTKKQPKYGRDN